MTIEVVSAPADPYKPPAGAKRNRFQVGHKVLLPDNREAVITDIEKGYCDRAGKWQRRHMYRVDWPNMAGSPRVCFAGWELRRCKREMDVIE